MIHELVNSSNSGAFRIYFYDLYYLYLLLKPFKELVDCVRVKLACRVSDWLHYLLSSLIVGLELVDLKSAVENSNLISECTRSLAYDIDSSTFCEKLPNVFDSRFSLASNYMYINSTNEHGSIQYERR